LGVGQEEDAADLASVHERVALAVVVRITRMSISFD
jgi:hypothetical protein